MVCTVFQGLDKYVHEAESYITCAVEIACDEAVK